MGIAPAEWLVAPMVAIGEERAAVLLTDRFGVEGTLEDLGSNHDRNFRVRTGPNEHGYVFKIFNPVIDRGIVIGPRFFAHSTCTAGQLNRLRAFGATASLAVARPFTGRAEADQCLPSTLEL